MPTHEREIIEPVELCGPDGRLLPDAIGWSRTPLHTCDLRGWGRNKRWEYWCVTTPTHLIAITVGDIDYLAVCGVYFLEYGGLETGRTATIPLARGVRLPDGLDGDVVADGPVRVGMRREPEGTGIRVRCATPHGPLEADLLVTMPVGHETLGVVIPWSDRRFQYTSKQNTRPAEGTVTVGGARYDFAGGWGVLDHGRGRWPYDTRWNWGAASGTAEGRTVGLQLGGRWTVGTGMTENALCVDGRLTKIGEELEWRYHDFDEPWEITTPNSEAVRLTFTPFHERADRTNAGVIATDAHQCFGHYTGTVRPDGGAPIRLDGLLGWAEQVHMRW